MLASVYECFVSTKRKIRRREGEHANWIPYTECWVEPSWFHSSTNVPISKTRWIFCKMLDKFKQTKKNVTNEKSRRKAPRPYHRLCLSILSDWNEHWLIALHFVMCCFVVVFLLRNMFHILKWHSFPFLYLHHLHHIYIVHTYTSHNDATQSVY